MTNHPKNRPEIQTPGEVKKLHAARKSQSQGHLEEQAATLAKLILSKAVNYDTINQKVYLYGCPNNTVCLKHETRVVEAAVRILRSRGWLVKAEQAARDSNSDACDNDGGRLEWVVEFYTPLRWHIHHAVWSGAMVLVAIYFALCQYFG